MPRDYRDLTIEHLAEVLAATDAELIEAVRDRDAYRLALQIAIGQLSTLTTQNERLRICLKRDIPAVFDERTAA